MQMQLEGNRLGKFSFQVRRLFVGCALALCALAVANYYFEWGVIRKIPEGVYSGFLRPVIPGHALP